MSSNHVVTQGECLSSIARSFRIADWRTIYNHAANAEFRQKRPNPNILYPGDELLVPDPELREENCATEKRHCFVRHAYTTTLHVIVEDEMGRPFRAKEYDLTIGNRTYHGTTGNDGSIQQKIAANETTGELTVHASGGGFSWTLDIGYLDPHDTDEGIQHRLHNLGFDVKTESHGWDAASIGALKAFQYAAKLPVTGDVDDATRDKLLAWHDHV
jgi:N-acetylmuramoyl-L-alanine amidase